MMNWKKAKAYRKNLQKGFVALVIPVNGRWEWMLYDHFIRMDVSTKRFILLEECRADFDAYWSRCASYEYGVTEDSQ